MDSFERWQWQVHLDLKLRRIHSDAFQDFFADVMEARHGADFVRVQASGRTGDKGCDGYVRSSGCLYQCYGKKPDSAVNAQYIKVKVQGDYAKAAAALAAIIKEWHFVHNLHDGLPIVVAEAIEELQRAKPQHVIGAVSPTSFQEIVLALPRERLPSLLGPVASAKDSANMNLKEVSALVNKIIADIETSPVTSLPLPAVPREKMQFNNISGHWRQLIEAASANARYVGDYVDRHPDPEAGTRLAKAFNHRYRSLKLDGLKPTAILGGLYEGVTGVGSSTSEQQVAAQAILAYLFDACDIFEDHPSREDA